jgi:hypothetical protein
MKHARSEMSPPDTAAKKASTTPKTPTTPATIASPTSPTSPAFDFASEIFKIVAEKHGLTLSETLLMAVCECTLRLDVDHIAPICREARISDQQVQLHGTEIGTDKELRPAMVLNIRKFVQFFYTLQKLKIIQLEGPIHGRTLLGFESIKILDKQKWLSVIHFACDSLEYFGSKITVYERILDFGYGPSMYTPRTRKNNPTSTPSSATQKKTAMLLNTQHWTFRKERLDKNVKRYTNGHTKPAENLKLLNILAQVAMETEEK